MGAQGGGDYSDVEVGRAVVFMANNGGAKFDEPKAPAPAASAGPAPFTGFVQLAALNDACHPVYGAPAARTAAHGTRNPALIGTATALPPAKIGSAPMTSISTSAPNLTQKSCRRRRSTSRSAT